MKILACGIYRPLKMYKVELRDRKAITFTILEEKCGSDREGFSEESISGILLRKNTLEMNRFFP